MAEEMRIKHIEVRTMTSDQRSIKERGGGKPIGYVPDSASTNTNEPIDNETTKQAPKPPTLG